MQNSELEFTAFSPYNKDAIVELIDSLSSNQHATSPVMLSLNPLFTRQFSSIARAIESFYKPRNKSAKEKADELFLVKQNIQKHLCTSLQPEQKNIVLGLDVTPNKRPYAKKLDDKSFVHSNEPISSKKPISIGHNYSYVNYIPKKSSWAVPLSVERVPTNEKATVVGIKQIISIIDNKALSGNFIGVGDCSYSSIETVYHAGKKEELTFIARLRSNRKLMRPATEQKKGKGRKSWFDTKNPFDLKDETTWGDPDKKTEIPWTTKKGKQYTVTIKAWSNLRSRGKKGFDIHNISLTVVRISVTDKGNSVYKNPLWLVIAGNWKILTLENIWDYYRLRFNIEHFFRFGKTYLLMNSFQTPYTANEENWMLFLIISYNLLYHARTLAQDLPNRWENKKTSDCCLSPRRVQRDMPRILKLLGPVADPVKPRGIPAGRAAGAIVAIREDKDVVIKSPIAPLQKKKIIINLGFGKDNELLKPRINCIGAKLSELSPNILKIVGAFEGIIPNSTAPPA